MYTDKHCSALKKCEASDLPETYRTICFSTGILRKHDVELFDSYCQEELSMMASRDTGYFLKLVGDEQKEILSSEHSLSLVSDQLKTLIIDAAEQGYGCIEFDRDVE